MFWLIFDQLLDYDLEFLQRLATQAVFMGQKRMDDMTELMALMDDTMQLGWLEPPPRIGTVVESDWELVAAYRSSNREYNVNQFYQVTVRPFDSAHYDAFRPDHPSTLHMVEVRCRNEFWYTVVIWRMSLLNHGQCKLHEFDFTCNIGQEQELMDRFADGPSCFETDGVIFVCLVDHICVYDTRLDVAVDYNGEIRQTWGYNGESDDGVPRADLDGKGRVGRLESSGDLWA